MTNSVAWADFYLICFAIGFCFSFFSFVFGGSRTGKLHLPHFHGHGVSAGHGPAVSGQAAATPGTHPAAHGNPRSSGGVSPFNFVTGTAFLAWFGGTGYLFTRYSSVWVGVGLLASIASGLVGGSLVFLFLSRVLISDEEDMDPANYEMVGVLGRVCSSIRESGTGEMIYSQMGTRRVCGVCSEDGSAVPRGTEVVVTRYEKGIAYVRLWSEMSGEDGAPSASSASREQKL